MDDKLEEFFQKWDKKCTDDYINAICKPCWELKYCPYGVLVEDFGFSEDKYYNCKIFGHTCPVFKVAEPITETKELRNLSRAISEQTKRKVTRRDDNYCQKCNQHIRDNEINYDHIIPWSKGGSSNESNIRLLCEKCNKERGNKFEEEYLVANATVGYSDPKCINLKMISELLYLFYLVILLDKNKGSFDKDCFLKIIETNDKETDLFITNTILYIWDLFKSEPFFISIKKKESILKYRWGLKDGCIHSVEETCIKFKVNYSYYINLENQLLGQIGLILIIKDEEKDAFVKYTINTEKQKFISNLLKKYIS